ncbi:carbohydrate ABC transporter permease [Halalkalibacter hemicellulosilyticus]|uniref:Probable ABC transporter permease protein ytcP n=1 Tax=Halalkalibacter hemicellulosilyticusJCM 9152 TaxID=1236971 RepID=W4QH31_9BACI|nr:carbohydrate ABC transporter permease [Halalkalibacter hemicellulosilyticus]GAE30654.1 probable ABC transporter permease protein ytcP [Halalkalibacter hemicellulosilyticusJCM 9152]
MVKDRSIGSKIFDATNITLLTIIALLCILPFLHVVAASFTTSAELADKRFVLIPTVWSLDAYRYIFSTDTIMTAMMVSIGVTVGGTIFSMFLSTLTAYGLSRKDLVGRRFLMFFIVFTLLFNGGMIPTFLVVQYTGLLNSLAALIVPVAINAFNMIILKSFFQNLPAGLEESAKIDGCSDFGILFRIVIPCSMPAIATISLFYAVTYWNTYMHAILYLSDSSKWPVQVLLRQVVVLASGLNYDGAEFTSVPPPEITVKMAVIVVATIPVLAVYPFLQKYFAKGALLGSMKG